MSSVSVIFGTTNTLPVGTPSHTFERVYQRSYKPFLRLMYNTPGFPLTMHFSGTMLSWLDTVHSEFTDVLAEMTQRRQVELIGGAFYDPVFSLIPAKDRLGQVESLTTLIRQRFGRRPRGAWITEHVWEPSLASTLRNSGIEYVFLDDYNLIAGGVPADELHKACLTEDQGKTLIVFPTRSALLARIGIDDPAEMIEELSRVAHQQPGSVVSLMFDGTLYGTSEDKGAHEDRWLERFIGLVNENSEWITPTTPWRYTRRAQARKRYYFPATSFEEMMIWSMEPERQRCLLGIKKNMGFPREENGYLSGGYFRHFLTRYVESNLLYSKMQYTCVLVNQIRGDKYRKQAARHELWKGQCHQAYWHGRPGGIYQNNLRKAAYSSLIEAEKVTREKGIFIPSIVKVDFDMDGLDEYLFQGQELNAYVHRKSGALFELDYLARPWNYLDSLTRRPEKYHEEYDEQVAYDGYWRKAFIDHLFADSTTIDDFEAGRFDSLADLPSEYYEVPRYEREGGALGLEKDVELFDGGRVAVRKEFTFERSKVVAKISLSNSGSTPVNGWYGCEVNLSFASEDVDALRVHVLPEADPASARKNMARKLPTGRAPASTLVSEVDPEKQVFSGAGTVVFEDLKNQVDITVSMFESVECWSLPVRTRSLGENGLTSTYQSSCILPRWRLTLEPQQQCEFYLELRINGE